MTTQPEALRLADIVGEQRFAELTGNNYGKEAAAELRHLYALNQELLEALKSMLEDARHDRVTVEVFNQAAEAIAKAEGRV